MGIFDKLFKSTEKPRHFVDSNIFKEYDIRGIYSKNLFDKDAFLIGRAVALSLQNKGKIVVGYDGRNSSPRLVKELIRGLVLSGIQVINIGLCHTPLVYFAVATHDVDMGIMITGSHNPKDYNGFKLVNKTGAIFGKQIQNIRYLIQDGKFADGMGREVLLQNFKNEYIKRVLQDADIYGDMNVAWDIGNGATSEIVRRLVRQLPGNHVFLHAEIDGNFPERDPDPTIPENLTELIDTVKRNSLDLGIAFDGDGDRIAVIDNTGRFLYGDQLLSIFARGVLKETTGVPIIVDVKTSNLVVDDIRKHGGIPIMERSGHSVIKAKMQETKAVLAGEISGHVFFADKWYGFDDGVYSAVRLLEIYSQARNIGEDIFKDVPSGINTPEIRIDCPDNNQFDIINLIKNKLKEDNMPVIEIDGVRVESDLGWWLIRASNTQNQITIRIESKTDAGLQSLKDEVNKYLAYANVGFKI